MSFAITATSLCAVGLAIVALLRLETGSRAADVALAWFVGSGWFAVAMVMLRFAANVGYSALVALAVVAAPIAAWAVQRLLRADESTAAPLPRRAVSRWVPRPIWLFAPIAAYVLLVTLGVALHGFNTPTHTDDAIRVRAFAPMLAFDDAWGPAARSILVLAGAIPTFVPSLAWRVTGVVDHFHANYVVLTDLIALLVLAIALASSRGRPERGWAMAFALLSLPLFVYHCTSTYSDAVLAMFVGAGFLFAIEYADGRDGRDAVRAMLLFALAAMVKREGWIVATPGAAVVFGQAAWNRRRGEPVPLKALALACIPFALDVGARAAAVGPAEVLPFLKVFATRAAGVAPAAAAVPASVPPDLIPTAWEAYVFAVFRSGNPGMLFWLLPAVALLRVRTFVRPAFLWPFATVLALFIAATVSSVWLFPAFTIDNSTVHRALIPASVTGALWLAALATNVPAAAVDTQATPPAKPAQPKRRGRQRR